MSDDLVARLKALALAASPGEWAADGVESRESGRRTKHFVMQDESRAVLFDSFNSETQCLDDDGDGLLIDTVASKNFAYIEAAQPIVMLALLDCVEALQKALRDSGCDGDLCAYEWHERARHALANLHEVAHVQ